ncbi:no pollen germination related 2 [Actinidia rufa]|uniref:No pollen germination related 2 n=1 Tax=Actinidia rufa TaxID=165716 RepID=A0A7J0H3S8_9ERIC|nr:no pollen germination related 2 [Actinidia rufa]
MSKNRIEERRRPRIRQKLRRIMNGYTSNAGEIDQKPDTGNIEEAESSLRESGCLNYEEARALLGRYEYQKGNVEAALHVFEGIDIAAVTPKMRLTLGRRGERHRRWSQSEATPPMSIHAVSLLLEAVYLKGKVVTGSWEETLNKAVELLPELWKLADSPCEAILSKPPDLRSQMDSSFVPRNNIEEAILLLMILLRKVSLKRIDWDPSIMDHLSYALSVLGELRALAKQVEELFPGIMDRKDAYLTLSLCYYGDGDNLTALNLLRKLLSSGQDPHCVPALLMASKICGENPRYAEEGINFAQRALESLQGKCDEAVGVANCLLGISYSAHSRSVLADVEKVKRQSETLQSLENAGRKTRMRDPNIVYHVSLENAEQRKLDAALFYAKLLLKLEGGSNLKTWILLAQILSAQKRFLDAETIINAALDQTGRWDQGELLRTKAKLQIAQGQLKNSIETYTQILAVLQVQNKSFDFGKKHLKGNVYHDRTLELETWHDLAHVYISLSQWRDAEICVSKSEAIRYHSASRWHVLGLLQQAKGLHKEALKAFRQALDVEPTHVPSLVSIAVVLRHLSSHSPAVVRSFLTEALLLDRMNASAWYNLGLLYKDEGTSSALEAAECFEAASVLEETSPVENFR